MVDKQRSETSGTGYVQPGKSTVDAIFVLRQLQKKFGAKKKKLFLVLVDVDKAFDCVPREAIQ